MRALWLVLLVGCAKPSAGGAGPIVQLVGDAGAVFTPATISCTPGQYFCEGSALWKCTHNGDDANNVLDCASLGKACKSSGCTAGDAACCL